MKYVLIIMSLFLISCNTVPVTNKEGNIAISVYSPMDTFLYDTKPVADYFVLENDIAVEEHLIVKKLNGNVLEDFRSENVLEETVNGPNEFSITLDNVNVTISFFYSEPEPVVTEPVPVEPEPIVTEPVPVEPVPVETEPEIEEEESDKKKCEYPPIKGDKDKLKEHLKCVNKNR